MGPKKPDWGQSGATTARLRPLHDISARLVINEDAKKGQLRMLGALAVGQCGSRPKSRM
ncbi:hypothetical protein [Streptomyces sp. NPDC001250]|uniref:hypothetical protein n=1 Tax=unclassified Streptomyces TaxID=2593676 RepID=UPI0033276B43